MRIQGVTRQFYTKQQSKLAHNQQPKDSTYPQQESVAFKGIGGIIQGGLKGTMFGLLGGAVAAASLPVLLGAAAVGAVAGAIIDDKLEDMAEKDKDEKDK